MALLRQTLVLQRLLVELSRCRRLADEIQTLGSAGAFASALLRASVERAEYASASADPAAMSRCLDELEAFEDSRPRPTSFAAGAARARAEPVHASPAAIPAWH